MADVADLFAFWAAKKRNDVFILYRQCGSLCGKRGGDSHVALRYLFTSDTHPNTLLCPRRHGSHASTTQYPPLLPLCLTPTSFCIISDLHTNSPNLSNQHFGTFSNWPHPSQIDYFCPYFLRSLSPLILFQNLDEELETFEAKCETLFLLELTLLDKKQLFYNLPEKFTPLQLLQLRL